MQEQSKKEAMRTYCEELGMDNQMVKPLLNVFSPKIILHVGSAQELHTSHSISLFYAIGAFVEMDQKNLSKSSGKKFGKKIWRNIFADFFPRHCVL
jgi:hypothetical protein